MKFLLFAVATLLTLSINAFPQSCGSGPLKIKFVDEKGEQLLSPTVELFIVSRDQDWILSETSPAKEWLEIKERKLADGTRIDRVWQLFDFQFESLLEQRAAILEKSPTDEIFVIERQRRSDLKRGVDGYTGRVTEGCALMSAVKVTATGFETAYYAGEFTCGCRRNFVLRLEKVRKKCLERKD